MQLGTNVSACQNNECTKNSDLGVLTLPSLLHAAVALPLSVQRLGTLVFSVDALLWGNTGKIWHKYWVFLDVPSPYFPGLSPPQPRWDQLSVLLSQKQHPWPSISGPLAFRIQVGSGGPSGFIDIIPKVPFPSLPCPRPPT